MANFTSEESGKPRRLRRLETVWTARGRPLFFVTFCTEDRRRWLDDPEIHRAFLDFCVRSPEQASVWVGKYVMMPDHVHVFVSAEGSQSLSRWVGALKRHLAKVRRETGKVSPGMQPRPTPERKEYPDGPGRAWQDGFFDHVLRSGESYGEKWNYVRMNPVRAGLVVRPEDWPYAGEVEELRW